LAADVQHGIGFTKGCASPAKVGDPYTCTWTIRNVLDDAQDTQTINQITDTVHAAGGNVSSSTVLDDATVTPTLGATCTPPPNRTCTLPFGSKVIVGPFSFYTVQGTDFTGANPLRDDANLSWHDLCDDPAHTGDTNCNPNPPAVGASSQAVLQQRASSTATTIHDAGHNPVTVVESGSVVHDFVSVTTNDPSPLQGTPSGTVALSFFANNQCSAPAAATSGPIALAANGTVDATSFPQGPLGPGMYAFEASYSGDGVYAPSTGGCEPLQVVDANIQITPLTATNPVGTNHTLTGHVNVNDGSGAGFVNAPDGTTITFSLTNLGGATATFVGPSSCVTTGGTGSCQVVISSPTAGTTQIHAATTVNVGGIALTRATGDSHSGDSPDALKTWIVTGQCPTGPLGGVNIGGLANDLFFFADGRTDANWQSSSPGYVGDVTVNGLLAKLRTSGKFAYAGTISTNAATLAAWQAIVDNNPGQAFAQYNQTALVTSRNNALNAAFQQIDALPVTPGFANRSSSSLDGLNFQDGVNQTIVINVTSGFQISKQINISGDAGDVIILRWDTDQNFANGYQGQVKFQSGGAIVPSGGLTPGNFISVAGDIDSSGGGKTPAPPFPQGPRLNNGTGALINGAKDFNGGGFFTGYWLTTGAPTNPADATHVLPFGDTAPLSNGIFVGGWYTLTTKFSMTSGTSGAHVCPNPTALRSS
jgi:hypothetical protein